MTDQGHKDIAVRGRWAVAAMFFVNGFITGSWAPQIPTLLVRLEISKFTLGLLILLFGAGAVVAMSWCGHFIARYGSGVTLKRISVGTSFGLLLVAIAPDVTLAAVAMVIFGGLIGAMDVAMNTNAVVVERRLGRAIMSSSHGFWSLGGFVGGGLGGMGIQTFGHLAHAVIITIVALAGVSLAMRHVVTENRPATAQERPRFTLPRNPLIYLIGVMALFSMTPEGAVLDWAAIYLQQELGADLATASLAFAAFSGVMACMRFAGDSVRNRFGAVTTLRACALLACAGMLGAGLSPLPWIAIACFALCGVGIANMVPIAFSAAGNQQGIPSGIGMSVVTTMGYCGILVAPSAIGFIAEHIGFGPVFIGLSGLLFIVFLMSGLAHRADYTADHPGE